MNLGCMEKAGWVIPLCGAAMGGNTLIGQLDSVSSCVRLQQDGQDVLRDRS
jgi:hypothetical protein